MTCVVNLFQELSEPNCLFRTTAINMLALYTSVPSYHLITKISLAKQSLLKANIKEDHAFTCNDYFQTVLQVDFNTEKTILGSEPQFSKSDHKYS